MAQAISDVEFANAGEPEQPGAACFAYERFGLAFSWEPDAALRSGRFRFSGFEQPIAVAGTLRAGDVERAYDGRGERDHSWGPRHWNLEWIFTVLNGDDLRLQCAEARIPNLAPMRGGYVARETSQSITAARLDYRYHDESLERAVEGPLEITTEDGQQLAFELETISAVEIDITHTFAPRPSARSIAARWCARAAPTAQRCSVGPSSIAS